MAFKSIRYFGVLCDWTYSLLRATKGAPQQRLYDASGYLLPASRLTISAPRIALFATVLGMVSLVGVYLLAEHKFEPPKESKQAQEEEKDALALTVSTVSLLPVKKIGDRIKANIYYDNNGLSTIEVKSDGKIMAPSFDGAYWDASPEKQAKEQDIFWSIYESTTAIDAAPVIRVAPHVRPWWTADGPVMTEKISKDLKEMKGASLVFVMGRFIWHVHDKTYGYDFCLFFKGGAQVFSCFKHNGPTGKIAP